jgi:acyl-CoA synthetase (NDP forming)
MVHGEREAAEAARSLGWPVVMKVVSPGIVHKTEVGGVVVNVRSGSEAGDVFHRLSSLKSGGPAEGILITPFQDHEVEVFAGMVRDAQFGPVITFGLGGVWIEVFQDVVYGIAPLSDEEASEMLQSIRGHSILTGARGRKPADCQALSGLLVRLSRMALAETEIQEIDLNPVFPLEAGYFIADARIIIQNL